MFAEMAYKGNMEKPTQHTSPGKEVRGADLSLHQELIGPRPGPVIPWEDSCLRLIAVTFVCNKISPT